MWVDGGPDIFLSCGSVFKFQIQWFFNIKNLQFFFFQNSKNSLNLPDFFPHGSITQPKIYKDFFIFFNSRIYLNQTYGWKSPWLATSQNWQKKKKKNTDFDATKVWKIWSKNFKHGNILFWNTKYFKRFFIFLLTKFLFEFFFGWIFWHF